MPNSGSWSAYFSATAAQARPGVGGVRGHVGEEHLAQHEDVVAAADRVGHDEDRPQHAVGGVARRLVGARAVEAPDRQLIAVVDDLGLRPQHRRSARCRRSRCTQPCRPSGRSPPDVERQLSGRLPVVRWPTLPASVSRPLPICERYVNRRAALARRDRPDADAMHGRAWNASRTTCCAPSRSEGSGSSGSGSPTCSASSSRSPSPRPSSRTPSRRACTSTARRSTASAACRRATCSPGPTRTPSSCCRGPRATSTSARMFCDIVNLDGTPFEGDPRQVLKRNLDQAHERGFSFYVAPEMEFFYFADGDPAPRAPAARQRLLLRPHHGRRRQRPAQAHHPHARGDGHPGRVLVPRGRPEPARDRPALHRRPLDGRQRHDLPPRRARDRARADVLRHVHAQAARRACRARACTPTSRCSRATPTPSTTRATSTACRRSPAGFIAGLLHHAREITAVTNQLSTPTSGSSSASRRRIYTSAGPATTARRSCGCRSSRRARQSSTRIEYRAPDPACNPYLAFSVILAAGLKGIEEGYELPAGGHRQRVRAHPRGAGGRGHRRRCRSRWPTRSTSWRGPSWWPRRSASTSSSGSCATSGPSGLDYKAQVTQFELDRYLPNW